MSEKQFTATHLGLITATKQNLLDLQKAGIISFESLVSYLKQLDDKFDKIYKQLKPVKYEKYDIFIFTFCKYSCRTRYRF